MEGYIKVAGIIGVVQGLWVKKGSGWLRACRDYSMGVGREYVEHARILGIAWECKEVHASRTPCA